LESRSRVRIAALGTALAYVLYFRILASAGATNLLLVTLLMPVSAIVLGTSFSASASTSSTTSAWP
jgi:hypothetical protein